MKVGVVGLGYVGLPLAVSFAEAGCGVVGLDASSDRVAELQAGRSPVGDVTDERLEAIADRQLLQFHDAGSGLGWRGV